MIKELSNVLKYICKKLCQLSDNNFSNLKIQKLLYLIQAYSLVKFNKYAFEEKIEAWQYGPVIPEAYYYLKIHKDTVMNLDIEFTNTELDLIINDIYEIFKDWNEEDLIKLTCSFEPWINTYRQSKEEITKDEIKKYHLDMLSKTGFVF